MKRIMTVLLIVGLLWSLSVPSSAVSAKGAVLINGSTGSVLYAKGEHTRLPMASTTKIMTALLLCENADLDETLVTTEQMVTVEGSSMGLLPGDTVSYRDLLYGMMLASGNDAANTTAVAIGGSVEGFVEMMNEKVKEIGLENTHFVTPSGLDADEHYSTAYDMAVLARYALENKDFAAACGAEHATLHYGNPPYNRTLKNHNRLLGAYDGMIGVKTGFTKKSGRCLVTAARREEGFLIAVTLSDPDDWQDHKELLDYGFSLLSVKSEKPPVPETLSVVGGRENAVGLLCDDLELSLTEAERKALSCRICLPRFLYAPVKEGERIGYAEYSLDGRVIATRDITAQRNVKMAESGDFDAIMRNFLMLIKAMV